MVIAPAVIARKAWRLLKDPKVLKGAGGVMTLVTPGMLGIAMTFCTGLLALRWLSRWLEAGRRGLFGFCCFVFAGVVVAVG